MNRLPENNRAENSRLLPDAAIEAELRSYFATSADRPPTIEAFWQRLSPQLEAISMSQDLKPHDATSLKSIVQRDNEQTALPSFLQRYTPAPRERSTNRWRTGAAIAAVIGLIAVFALVVHSFVGDGHSTVHINKSPHPATHITHPGAWEQGVSFHVPVALTLSTIVSVAPSDPNVIYEQDSSLTTFVLHRSDDGGKTWHSYAVPHSQYGGYFNDVLVSPLNAQMVIATISFNSPNPACSVSGPTGVIAHNNNQMAEIGAFAGGYNCEIQYVSTNGGNTWNQIDFPIPGHIGLDSMDSDIGPIQTLMVQGNRIYAVFASNFSGTLRDGFRLVSSTDLVHWTVADAQLVAQQLLVTEYAATPNGSTLFATTVPQSDGSVSSNSLLNNREFWRSDDGGSHWTDLGKFPEPQDSNMESHLLGAANATNAALVYYGIAPGQSSTLNVFVPDNIFASSDNGKTWRAAPMGNFTSDQKMELWPTFNGINGGPTIGSLDDGSLLLIVSTRGGTPALTGIAIYAWKPGDATWTEVSQLLAVPQGPVTTNGLPVAGYGLQNQWFTPAQNGTPARLWALTIQNGVFTLWSCTLG